MGVGNGGPWLMDTTTTSTPVATYSAIHHPPSPPVILRKWENEGIYTLWWWSWPRLLLWCRDALNSYVFCPNLPRTWERNRFSIPSRCLQFPLHLPENAFFASWYCWIPLNSPPELPNLPHGKVARYFWIPFSTSNVCFFQKKTENIESLLPFSSPS